ncbi:hypothetical protein CY34DRAFT_109173 [Suillus luteus UH-Slu-Lm8-n1]|uniref:Uncharacterized protein n=1 Tax=Suillus luteus UH-Slu-Lm8-n1 TaxID=930992 RepID=A0A0C9ZIN5_9AGAM|nr:hypothetical protein CY34DRAFT_109173 [Suillus luteus UH-Slu-Lm8-n1]
MLKNIAVLISNMPHAKFQEAQYGLAAESLTHQAILFLSHTLSLPPICLSNKHSAAMTQQRTKELTMFSWELTKVYLTVEELIGMVLSARSEEPQIADYPPVYVMLGRAGSGRQGGGGWESKWLLSHCGKFISVSMWLIKDDLGLSDLILIVLEIARNWLGCDASLDTVISALATIHPESNEMKPKMWMNRAKQICIPSWDDSIISINVFNLYNIYTTFIASLPNCKPSLRTFVFWNVLGHKFAQSTAVDCTSLKDSDRFFDCLKRKTLNKAWTQKDRELTEIGEDVQAGRFICSNLNRYNSKFWAYLFKEYKALVELVKLLPVRHFTGGGIELKEQGLVVKLRYGDFIAFISANTTHFNLEYYY